MEFTGSLRHYKCSQDGVASPGSSQVEDSEVRMPDKKGARATSGLASGNLKYGKLTAARTSMLLSIAIDLADNHLQSEVVYVKI